MLIANKCWNVKPTSFAVLAFALLTCNSAVFGQDVEIGSSSSHLTESEINESKNALATEIHNKVINNWLRPITAADELACTIEVKMLPSGELVNSIIVKSSGNLEFDQSALEAVSKSSPFPKIPHKDLYRYFMQFQFVFKPE